MSDQSIHEANGLSSRHFSLLLLVLNILSRDWFRDKFFSRGFGLQIGGLDFLRFPNLLFCFSIAVLVISQLRNTGKRCSLSWLARSFSYSELAIWFSMKQMISLPTQSSSASAGWWYCWALFWLETAIVMVQVVCRSDNVIEDFHFNKGTHCFFLQRLENRAWWPRHKGLVTQKAFLAWEIAKK